MKPVVIPPDVEDQVRAIFWNAGCIVDGRVKGDYWRIHDLLQPAPTFDEMAWEFEHVLEERERARRARRREHWLALWSFIAQPTIFREHGWSRWSFGIYLRTLLSFLIGWERSGAWGWVEVTVVWVAARNAAWCAVHGPTRGFGYEIVTDWAD